VLAERLTAVCTAPLTATTARAAQDAMRTLAHRSAGAQRIPVVEYLIAAAAQETGAAVLHDDRDYDTLARDHGVRVRLARAARLAPVALDRERANR